MILQIDSNFRDFRIYPDISQFTININAESYLPENDVRSTYVTDFFAEYVFSWFGNTQCPGISKLPNDSVQIQFIPISSQKIIIVDFIGVNVIIKNDFLVGLLFSSDNQSSQIIQYNSTTRVALLQDSLFQEFQSNFCYGDPVVGENDVLQGYITNFSFFWKKNLTILGSSPFFPTPALEFLLAEGLSTSLFVQNVTKQWTSRITSVKGRFRNAILEDMPSYSSNDLFIVWKKQSPYMYESLFPLSAFALYRFVIHRSGTGFSIGQLLHSLDFSILCTVTSIDVRDGSIFSLEINLPGDNLSIGQEIILYDEANTNTCTILVTDTKSVLRVSSPFNSSMYFSSQTFLLGIVNKTNQSLFYLYYLSQERQLIYFNIDIIDFEYLNNVVFQEMNRFQVFFIPYRSNLPSINIPRISLQEKTCYKIRLLSISLPNLPVCGYDVLLSFFPYVIVTLSNGPGSNLEDTLLTNNPNAFSSNFIVPIANIKNPLIVRFVSIRSPFNSATMKLFLRDSIFFSVRIPNGELLRFKTSNQIVCSSLDEPLNKLYSPNDRQIFVSNVENSINAVFELIQL
jgi:hypothetical protein